MYPPTRQCDEIDNVYNSNQENYLKFAEVDKTPTKAGFGLGIYQCYCLKHSDNVKSILTGPEDFCYAYNKDGNITQISSKLVSFLITVFNMLIRSAVQKIVSKINLNFQS